MANGGSDIERKDGDGHVAPAFDREAHVQVSRDPRFVGLPQVDAYMAGRRVGTRIGVMYGAAFTTVVLFIVVVCARLLARDESASPGASSPAVVKTSEPASAPVERGER